MGYWENTAYIEHGSVDEVADALTALLCEEGMTVFSPPQRQRLLCEPMQYDSALRNDRWGLALFPGAPNWTVIKTAPLELLCERRSGSARMRLADLCASLAVPGFQFNVYDSTGAILAEASASGEVTVSGFDPQGEDDLLNWHDERLDETFFEAQFQQLPLQSLIADAPYGEYAADILSAHCAGEHKRYCDNRVCVEMLITHQPFDAPGGRSLYLQWPGASRQRFNACNSWEEFRAQITSGG